MAPKAGSTSRRSFGHSAARNAQRNDERWQVLPVENIVLPQDGAEDEDWFRPGRKTESSTTYRWLDAIYKRDRRSLLPSTTATAPSS